MIKEALKYLVDELAPIERENINGLEYSSRPLHRIQRPALKPIETSSLDSLIQYLNNDCDMSAQTETILHIAAEDRVLVFSEADDGNVRDEYMVCIAPVRSFAFGRFHDPEEFNIALQSRFVQNNDSEYLLRVAGTIRDEVVKTVGDDGISQQIVVKNGVASVGKEVIRNRVRVAPYRTFIEVSQPESDFIFRMKDGPSLALFEADGGAWKLEAVTAIRDYLLQGLKKDEMPGLTIIW